MKSEGGIDLGALRRRLAGLQGPRYWRGLEELAETEEFRAALAAEFPAAAAPPWDDPLGRRRFLKLMGAALALAGVTGCTRQPTERIVPYVSQPEGLVPGRPLYYATAMPLLGYGTGVLVESHMGRPTKIEGNAGHPSSLGAASPQMQAAILGLYDPDRSRTLTHLGEIRPWGDFLDALRAAMEAQKAEGGAGLRLLTETVTSPTLGAQIRELEALLPDMRWHQWEPAGRDPARAGTRRAFGRHLETRYDLTRASVILSLDADFLASGPGHLRYAREFAAGRRLDRDAGDAPSGMNRLYVVEGMPSSTGAIADHRLPLRPSQVEGLAERVARELGVAGLAQGAPAPETSPDWIRAVARDLAAHRGAALVVAGEAQPPRVHALAHAMNRALGGFGSTVSLSEPVEVEPLDQTASLGELVDDMRRGDVRMLVILGGDPVYTAPADVEFSAALEKVGLRIHLAETVDETSARCHWHVPQAHFLETWGDVRAHDGTLTVMQPLIEPLFGGRSSHELLSGMLGRPNQRAHDAVRGQWQSLDDPAWDRALHDGVIAGTSLPPVRDALRDDWDPGHEAAAGEPAGLEVSFHPDPTVHDGRFVNNGWLQELPKPLTRLTWDNAALMAPATAERLGVTSEDVVTLRLGERSVEAPVWVAPGHAADAVTVHFGYGRRRAGRLADGTGFDAYRLRTSAGLWSATGAAVERTGARHRLACTQTHHSMEGRQLVRGADLEHYTQHPDFAQHAVHEPGRSMTLYPDAYQYEGHAWGMTIDLNACIGCGGCVVACQAENNIPTVGKEEVLVGREMHWIRVDRYFSGDLDEPRVHHQPVPCMHCENAPCELVCPVGATVHDSEGLNAMVYNRCVGTRYCSNNCPYKVRRFNFFSHVNDEDDTLKMGKNPNVTIRSRGVMEKCTYCVQRINLARIEAKTSDREMRDGDVVTACQATCPTQAITFGDLNEAGSRVARLKASPRNYGILTELNTRPRTTYLAAVRNPNPAIDEEGDA